MEVLVTKLRPCTTKYKFSCLQMAKRGIHEKFDQTCTVDPSVENEPKRGLKLVECFKYYTLIFVVIYKRFIINQHTFNRLLRCLRDAI